jgi:hypothetical protein
MSCMLVVLLPQAEVSAYTRGVNSLASRPCVARRAGRRGGWRAGGVQVSGACGCSATRACVPPRRRDVEGARGHLLEGGRPENKEA